MKRILSALSLATLLFAPTLSSAETEALHARTDLKTVSTLDLGRYAGIWYQIARNPVIFEWGCHCSRQVLTPLENGTIDVHNSCRFRSNTGRLFEIRGVAVVADTSTPSQLKVDFGLPWKGDYWIIAVDTDYRWAVVTDPREWTLYVLSKTPTLEDELYQQAVTAAGEQVDISKLYKTPQEGCWTN